MPNVRHLCGNHIEDKEDEPDGRDWGTTTNNSVAKPKEHKRYSEIQTVSFVGQTTEDSKLCVEPSPEVAGKDGSLEKAH